MTPVFGLGEYTDRKEMLARITNVRHEAQGTNTAEALAYLHTKVRPGLYKQHIDHRRIPTAD